MIIPKRLPHFTRKLSPSTERSWTVQIPRQQTLKRTIPPKSCLVATISPKRAACCIRPERRTSNISSASRPTAKAASINWSVPVRGAPSNFCAQALAQCSGLVFPTAILFCFVISQVVYYLRMSNEIEKPLLRLGTSSFTAGGWNKTFYPAAMNSRDYLSYYATQFDTLEIDSTYYGIPAITTVQSWYNKTPASFLFALKAPQEITHERVLVDVDDVLKEFLTTTAPLQEKLGMILLQFPYFNNKVFPSPNDFLSRLKPFLEKLPAEPRFALEIRNKYWLCPPFFDLLHKHKVALALIDHPWMPRPKEYFSKGDALTTDFTYIRWLGDRKAI